MVKVGGVVVVLAIVAGLLAWLLLDVYHAPEPRGVPVVLVGEGPPVAGIVGALEQDDVFEVTRAKSGAAARKLIAEREVYGAYAPRANAGRLLVAGAASPAVADLLRTSARAIDAKRGVKTVPTDIRPLPAADRSGLSPFWLAFVAGVVGALAGWLLELLAPSVRRGPKLALVRILALLVFSLVAGALMTLAATQLDLYPDDFAVVAGVLALATFGAATVSAFATSLLGGVAGAVVGLLVFGVLGVIVTSGGASAPELIPETWATIGSGLPGQSVVALIRNLVYFDNEAIELPLAVLGAYALGGVVLMMALSPFRRLGR
jgi:hypothetical protein